MAVGVYTDKQHLPTNREIVAALGKASDHWRECIGFVEEQFHAKGDWRYYGKNHGWALRFKKGGRALVSLYPSKGVFTAQMILSEGVVKKSRNLRLGPSSRAAIDRATPYPEGRWVFVAVGSKRDLRDVENLLLLKTGVLPEE